MSSKISLIFLFAAIVVQSYFGEVSARELIDLNDASWKFNLGDVSGAEASSFNDNSWLDITIPHDWQGGSDGVNEHCHSRSVGWYRGRFAVDPAQSDKKIVIEFEAAVLKADVWVNGEYCGNHKGGYTAFSFDISSMVNFGSDNVVAVKVDNNNDSTIAPWAINPWRGWPVNFDYAVFGGIYRDVRLIISDKVRIDEVFNTTPSVSPQSATVQVKTIASNSGATSQNVTLTTEVCDSNGTALKTMQSSESIAAGQSYTFTQTSDVISNPKLWSPDNPYVYKVNSTLSLDGQEIDRVESPLGFRWYHLAAGEAFKLNGRNTFIKGVNRHQDIEGYGYAVPNELHWQDVETMKWMGFNFVRHAHYPADQAFLDACDRLGLMVWVEIPVGMCISTEPEFLETSKSQLREMIRQSYNHPSVLLWGLGNESDFGPVDGLTETYMNQFFNELNDLAHNEDPTRMTVGCRWSKNSNQNIVDLYAPQNWSGWYCCEWGQSYTAYNPETMIGEYGSSITPWDHDEPDTAKQWSQEYACMLHEWKASVGMELKDQFPGHCVWAGFDFKSPKRDDNPLPCQNQKGMFL
ncbi:MAG: hypothetical protein GF350_06500, partial [Chitinivibrionales bacterium]|nr:hypothetical protein [Chitinivibrionales bacterium]